MNDGLSRQSEEVAAALGAAIREGRWREGQFLPPLREIARQQSAGYKTVWRAVKTLESQGLVSSEPRKGYRVVGTAATGGSPDGNGGRTLVFVHAKDPSEVSGGEHSRMWAGAREEAARHGMVVLVHPVYEDVISPETAAELAEVSTGVLCDRPDDESVQVLIDAGLKLVRIHNYRRGLPVDAVSQDDSGGVVRAVEYLASRGHQRIGYFDSVEWVRSQGKEPANVLMRLAGYHIATRRFRTSEDPGLIVPAGLDTPGRLQKLVEAGATAAVCPHGDLWRVCSEGVELPEDFGVVIWRGLEGGSDFPKEEMPSHVCWSREQMGRESVRRLVERLENPDMKPATILVDVELTDCGTGGRGPAARAGGQ
jgi:DNA-binding LacI/PurR family transcriptional regulator